MDKKCLPANDVHGSLGVMNITNEAGQEKQKWYAYSSVTEYVKMYRDAAI